MQDKFDFMQILPEDRHRLLQGYISSNDSFSERDDIKKTESISKFPQHTPLGMAYVPFQEWVELYDSEEAFPKGTIFPDLYYPFFGGENDV